MCKGELEELSEIGLIGDILYWFHCKSCGYDYPIHLRKKKET